MKKIITTATCLTLILCNAFATKHIITASGIQFSPNNISNVLVGDTMRWEWHDGSHTTTSLTIPGGATSWDHPLNSSNTSFEYPVIVAGTYNYKCTPHFSFGMTGTFTASLPVIDPCDTLNCDDADACTVDDCDSLTGCFYNPFNCDDGDPCTNDACSGVCIYTAINCDDGDGCTSDTCANGTCLNTAIVCDDLDSCTLDACDSGCVHTPIPGCHVGINDVAPRSDIIKIYPNPVQELLTFECAQSAIERLLISDILGKTTFDSGVINTSNYSIPLDEELTGLYLVTILTNNMVITGKIVVK